MSVIFLHLCLIFFNIFIMSNNNTITYHSEHIIYMMMTLVALSMMH